MMHPADVNVEARKLIEEHGVLGAYAAILNRIIEENEKWPRDIDQEKVANDRLISAAIAHRIAREEMFNEDWLFGERDMERRWYRRSVPERIADVEAGKSVLVERELVDADD